MSIINPICHAMWSLTPYDKCDFRCVYCCTRVQGTSKPIVPVAEFIDTLQRELDAIPADDLLIVGAFCDAYPYLEENLGAAALRLTPQDVERLDGALGADGVAGERYLPSGLAMVDR